MAELRQLQGDTYYGILKTMEVRDWQFRSLLERDTVVNTLRRELCISDDQHHDFLTKLERDASVARMKSSVGNGEAAALGMKRPRPEGVVKAAGGPPKRPAVGKVPGAVKQQAKAVAPAGVQFLDQPLDGLLGRRAKRYWPEEGGWFDAVITNFNPETGEHCFMYDQGTPNESWEWRRVADLSKDEIVWVQGPAVPLSQIVAPLPAHQAQVVRPPIGGGGGGRGGPGRKATTGGMPAVARQLEEAVNKAKDVSKLDEVQVQVEARMRELQQKLAALEEGGAAAAAPAPPPQQQQQQYVALEAPAAEVAGAPAEGGDHETSVSDDA